VSDRIITAFSTGTAGQAEVRAVEGVDEEVLEPDSPIFPRWSDMRNVLIGLGVLTALAQNVQTASAQGTTSIKIVEAKAAGTGPYTITSEGLVSIKIGEVFMGVQYQVLELAPGGATYVGFTNLPDGPPVPGMEAKIALGNTNAIPRKGNYLLVFSMLYYDKNGDMHTTSAIHNLTIK
jgi:hypothetical protein